MYCFFLISFWFYTLLAKFSSILNKIVTIFTVFYVFGVKCHSLSRSKSLHYFYKSRWRHVLLVHCFIFKHDWAYFKVCKMRKWPLLQHDLIFEDENYVYVFNTHRRIQRISRLHFAIRKHIFWLNIEATHVPLVSLCR